MNRIIEYLKGGKIVALEGIETNSEDVYISISKNISGKEIVTTIHLYHEQDCCETVQLEEFHGNINIGDTFISLEERIDENGDNSYGHQTWTFYIINTIQGTMTLRWLGESNGYYSESVDMNILGFLDGVYESEDKSLFGWFDGILSDVVQYKVVNGMTFAKLKDNYKRESYVVSNGKTSAHGNSFRSALYDLNYKINKRDKSYYYQLDKNHEFTFDEAIECYRVITGSCAYGTQQFIESRKDLDKSKKYTFADIEKITRNQYGHNYFRHFILSRGILL